MDHNFSAPTTATTSAAEELLLWLTAVLRTSSSLPTPAHAVWVCAPVDDGDKLDLGEDGFGKIARPMV